MKLERIQNVHLFLSIPKSVWKRTFIIILDQNHEHIIELNNLSSDSPLDVHRVDRTAFHAKYWFSHKTWLQQVSKPNLIPANIHTAVSPTESVKTQKYGQN